MPTLPELAPRLTFVDLFAGLGGFHLALQRLGHECVFASELNSDLAKLYQRNFGITPAGDLRDAVERDEVPPHDILCAGFPCQPFSKAGEQQGFDCPVNGDLFDYVARIIEHRRPRYVILENVPNLKRHNNGATWETLIARLRAARYTVDAAKLSPHHFGIPQIRERVFIVASRDGLEGFEWPTADLQNELSINKVLDVQPAGARGLPQHVIDCLTVWQDFLRRFPEKGEIPGGFPFWSMEWGATYPFEDTTPHAVGARKLRTYLGSHGRSLRGIPERDLALALPSYARSEETDFPDWKKRIIRLNRAFYSEHKSWMDKWLPSILPFPSSRQKLEWNCKGGARDIWQYVVQLRASGVRVKKRTTAPSLIAMTTTQVPIIAWERRYITVRECARLQSLRELTHFPDSVERSFKALGNAVNADVVELIARALLARAVTAPATPAEPAVSRVRGPRAATITAGRVAPCAVAM